MPVTSNNPIFFFLVQLCPPLSQGLVFGTPYSLHPTCFLGLLSKHLSITTKGNPYGLDAIRVNFESFYTRCQCFILFC